MKITSEQDLINLGKDFATQIIASDFADRFRIIELLGDVGAGKTTFTRGLAEGLGATAPVTSPSFTISKSYTLPHGRTLTHYDFYRLDDVGIMKENLDEVLVDKNAIVILEWSKSVADILPEQRTVVEIEVEDGGRSVKIVGQAGGARCPTRGSSEPGKARCKPALARGDGPSERRPERGHERQAPPTTRLYLDTSTPTTILKLDDQTYEWSSGKDLAEGLLGFIRNKLVANGKTFEDISEITFMSGPGSFTGLRIGAAVVNTLAHELNIPLYDHHGNQREIILPDYGRPANISTPRK